MPNEGKNSARATFTSSLAATSSNSACLISGRFANSCDGIPVLTAAGTKPMKLFCSLTIGCGNRPNRKLILFSVSFIFSEYHIPGFGISILLLQISEQPARLLLPLPFESLQYQGRSFAALCFAEQLRV